MLASRPPVAQARRGGRNDTTYKKRTQADGFGAFLFSVHRVGASVVCGMMGANAILRRPKLTDGWLKAHLSHDKIIIKMYLIENKEVTLFVQLNW